VEFADYSYISVSEAREKLRHVAIRLFMDQFKADFYIKSPLPEQRLKAELAAYWEGRIPEMMDWTDPLGQVADFVVEQFGKTIVSFWKDTLQPTLEDFFSPITDYLSMFKDILEGIPDFIESVTDFMGTVSDTIATVFAEQVAVVQTWITDGLATIPDLLAEDFLNIVNVVKDMWDDVIEAVSGSLETITKGLEAIPEAIAAGFKDAISYMNDVLNAFFQSTLVPFGEGIRKTLEDALNAAADMAAAMVTAMIDMAKAYAPISPTKAEDYAANVTKVAMSAGVGLGAAFLIGELLHPLKELGLGHLAAMLYRATGYDQFTGSIVSALVTTTLRIPLRYTFNAIFRPWLPSVDNLVDFRRRGLMSDKEMSKWLAYQGLADELHKYFQELAKSVPSVSDLVRFVVRECFPLEALPEAPPEFVESLKMWNMEEKWARAYWEAHWELPAYEQLVEAYFRGIITLEELRKFIVWHDYKPTPRPGISKSDVDIMNELIYKMPDKLDARWMLRWGIISRDEHKKLIAMTGLHPDWIEKVSRAEFMNNLMDERTALRSAIVAMFAAGYMAEEAVKQILLDAGFLEEEVELVLKSNLYRQAKEELDDYISAYVTAFRYGKISIEQLKQKLAELQIQDWKIARIVEKELARARAEEEEKREEEVRAYGYHIAMNRFEDGITNEADLESELRMLGYSEEQIERYKIAAKLERDRKYALEVLNAVKTAWKKNYIGDETFINTLRRFGFEEWKIQLELSLLKLIRGLMPTEEGEGS